MRRVPASAQVADKLLEYIAEDTVA